MATRFSLSKRQLSQQQQQQQHQSRARWTTFLTKVLTDLMVDQVYKGNRKNNSFNRKAWRCICDEFYKKTGLKWDKEQLKNRYSVLRRQYGLVKSLLDHGDFFTWDDSSGTIIATDEAWAKYGQGHADAENIKLNGCPLYKQLCLIFSESTTTNGKNVQSAELEGGISSSLPYPQPLNVIQEVTSSESEDEMADNEEFPSAMPSSSSTTVRKKGRKGIDDAIAGAILEMAAASKMRTAAVNYSSGRYTIANCIKELDQMQVVEEQIYLAALDLFHNRNARETFLSLKGEKRLTWLRRKCIGQWQSSAQY
ncbi:L10-interacting MYB domain-containing protein-like [Pistacia vera]|uniref:L10-interacting MYB domain-containing protein-like n=1 Tax=Pistacia vera TaxID=55513 RepID=UPI001263CBC4|nr:L10-interacting MYB domain-containing protein-like [Pistacia vera]XP_031271526.1 L10-interacting MYB domain-containing protein-like [Pistacia vera]XP_031271527.1 L10-interacting MYB domain-containing protein-like [Pistacia vera]